MIKTLKVNFSELEDIEIYEHLLDGRITDFPSGFWANRNLEESKEVAVNLLVHLIDKRLKLTEEDVKREISKKFLTK